MTTIIAVYTLSRTGWFLSVEFPARSWSLGYLHPSLSRIISSKLPWLKTYSWEVIMKKKSLQNLQRQKWRQKRPCGQLPSKKYMSLTWSTWSANSKSSKWHIKTSSAWCIWGGVSAHRSMTGKSDYFRRQKRCWTKNWTSLNYCSQCRNQNSF